MIASKVDLFTFICSCKELFGVSSIVLLKTCSASHLGLGISSQQTESSAIQHSWFYLRKRLRTDQVAFCQDEIRGTQRKNEPRAKSSPSTYLLEAGE